MAASAPSIINARDREGHEFRAELNVTPQRVQVALDLHSLEGNGWVHVATWHGNNPPTLDQLFSLRSVLQKWGIVRLEKKLLGELQAQTSLRLEGFN